MIAVSPYYELALEHHEAGRLQEADCLYRQALEADPKDHRALHLYGVLVFQTGQFDAGMGHIRASLRVKPDFAEAHGNLGEALFSLGRWEEAEASFRHAVRLSPDFLLAHNGLGRALAQQGKWQEAVAEFQQVVRLNPNLSYGHRNLGVALSCQGRLQEAIASLQQALRLDPNYVDALVNLASLEADQGNREEAAAICQQALALQPDCPSAHLNLGMLRLLRGDYAQGWRDYECRLKCADHVPPPYNQPIWDGASLAGRTILLYTEQGFGDTLQFIRYVPLVRARGGRVVVACPAGLLRLLSVCPGIDHLVPYGMELPGGAFDVQASLVSLPGIFGTTLTTVPAEVPYLFADGALLAPWREKLKQYTGFKIGIAWQGSPTHRQDYRRSMPLAQFAPLARLQGVQLFSLQKGTGTEQLAGDDPFSIIDLGSKLDNSGDAFVDTAAVMQCLDLVITSDTSIAHLAGALGVPVWVALSFVADWRWLRDREDSPWYPTMRLFRQREAGNWEAVFERMAAEVKKLLNGAATVPFSKGSGNKEPTGQSCAARPMTPTIVPIQQTYETAVRYHDARCYREADYLYLQVLQAEPQHVKALNQYGLLCRQTGRFDVGMAHIREALRLQPDFAEAHYNLGDALRSQHQLEEAEASFRQAVRLKPNFPMAHNDLGRAVAEQGRIAEAIGSFEKALRLDPNLAVAHKNLGVALSCQGKLSEAIACIEPALRLNPHYPEGLSDLASIYAEQGSIEKAVATYQQALDLQPDYASAHMGLGMIHLLQGNYEQGWREYEYRLGREDHKPPPYHQPIWDGSPLAERTILLYSEQGLGDDLQFIRFAAAVKARGGRVLAAFPAELLRIFASCPGIDRLLPFGTEPAAGEVDVQASIMSLPAILKTTLATLSAEIPYLFADPQLVAARRQQLTHHRGFKIGIAWQGNPKHRKDYRRSMPLTCFAPLAALADTQLFSLQKGPGSEQLAHAPFPIIDLGGKLDDLADTAAIMKNLDLIVTCDTACAHLAGALGVPVWVALSCVAEWRWLLDREDSPWYPTMRLFRQSKPGDWHGVFERMAAALAR